MALNVSMLRIKGAIATAYNNSDFSTVTVRDTVELHSEVYVTLFLEGAGHEDAAARIAALINEQVVRRDQPDTIMYAISPAGVVVVPPPSDDGPTYDAELIKDIETRAAEYDGPDDEQQRYEAEDRAGKEAHLRAVRRDDKPWTPHEDEIERDVAEGRRDADGELM